MDLLKRAWAEVPQHRIDALCEDWQECLLDALWSGGKMTGH